MTSYEKNKENWSLEQKMAKIKEKLKLSEDLSSPSHQMDV